jgi:hypothetical protein
MTIHSLLHKRIEPDSSDHYIALIFFLVGMACNAFLVLVGVIILEILKR